MCAYESEAVNANQNPVQIGSTPENRRVFLATLFCLGAVFVSALLSVPLIRFALFPLLRRTTELKKSPLGAVNEFSSLSEPVMRKIQIEQLGGWRKSVTEKAVYITKDGAGKLCVLTSVCPHLGCTVPWNKDKKQFICPCHGGTFNRDGSRVSGPSLRGMDALESSVEDGQLLVRFNFFRQLVAYKEIVG
jgi:menaquinol-cytochrome c reductase iron-sulfur subunit